MFRVAMTDTTPEPTTSEAPAAAPEVPAEAPPEIDDESRDAIHIMPLSVVPLKTKGLRHARLVKNSQLETMVELFHDKNAGSGQIPPHLIDRAFPADAETIRQDQATIDRLRALPSFDVFSLRIALRRLSIPIEDERGLSLSEKTRAELTDYMRQFTRPLMQYIYGEGKAGELNDITDILERLRTPDRAEARKRLDFLCKKLDVSPTELPRFLEDYGDIFLSLAYFRQILDRIQPQIKAFIEWADGIKESEVIRRDADTMNLLETTKTQLTQIVTSISARFDTFDSVSKLMWTDMNSDNFRSFRELVIANHTSIGSVLCGLSLKMDQWVESFPKGGSGPSRRADFLRNQMFQGLHRLAQEEKMAARAMTR